MLRSISGAAEPNKQGMNMVFYKQNPSRHQEVNQTGQGMVEYAILLLLIAAAAALSLTSLGAEVVNAFRKINWGSEETMTKSVIVSVLDAKDKGIGGVRVFAYDEQGDYLEQYQDTDENGQVSFRLENGRFQFLTQHQMQYYWSPTINRPGQNHTEILTGQTPFTVNILDTTGNGVAEIPVYVFTDEEEYIGVTGETDENGSLQLDLAEASIKFRVDADNITQWTEAIPTSDGEITITLNPCGTNQFLAEYFNNRTLSEAPVFTRCESAIDNAWERGGPGNGVNNDNFSIRWTGQFQFEEGTYAFRTTADDGVRVWLNGKNITDAWKYQPPTTYASRQQLSSGIHEVKMEYFEGYSYATAKLRWESVIDSCPDGQYLAEYFNNRNLSGDPTVVQCESNINYEWGNGSPVGDINNNDFSVRWTGKFYFAEGGYHFQATGDDGIRVWVDDDQIISAWRPQVATTYAARETLSAGMHTITMEFYEQGGYAEAKLNWKEAITDCPEGQFMAEYFNNRNLSGEPAVVRCEESINYNWDRNSPGDGINADNFSARWQGEFTFDGGETAFTVTIDDGMQLFVDSDLIIGAWGYHASKTYDATVDLSPGKHEVTINYFEAGGHAVAKVNWK
jgi:Flp pilus assembly pilin Flp